MAEWFEDEGFWEAMYPYLFSKDRFEAAAEEITKVLKLLALQGNENTILDLCCGPGRHAIALAKKGFQVTGVDLTSYLLEKAKKEAEKEKASIEWIQEDMLHFIRPNSYDLVLNMFTSFGYFDHKEGDRKVLHNIYQSLKPGGKVLIDVVGKESLAAHFEPTSSREMPDGALLFERRQIFDDWSRILNEWFLVQRGEVQVFKFHHTIYSAQELKDRLETAGFQGIQCYGDIEGREYNIHANRLLIVGTKKPA